MAALHREGQHPDHAAQELTCVDCGVRFPFRQAEQEHFAQMGWSAPKRCPSCRRKARMQREQAAAQAEYVAWQQKKAEEQKRFDALLMDWPVISIDEIRPKSGHVLYILGNGFDLMHGVRSSYYAFRDSLGKRNSLRRTLETWLAPDDIWADFESALAQFKISAMGSQWMADSWLDWMDAYAEDAGAAEYFMAIEAAASPLQLVTRELPRRFRMWVETLCVETEARPLKGLFQKGKVLCFNYTEFVETLYGVPAQDVCYLHGCRRNKKTRLILGHMSGASDAAFSFDDASAAKIKGAYRRAMSKNAQGLLLQLLSDYDDDLTKNCGQIIAAHASFFAGLRETESIIVIGHSFSPVDWDYFAEVAARLADRSRTRWYFGCHSLRDLRNLEQLLHRLHLERSQVAIFRTDTIHAAP